MAAILVWWRARAGGFFFVVGLNGDASANLGPILPAFCAGLSTALVLLLVDGATDATAGVVAAAVVLFLPGFIPLHQSSLLGPPLLALTLLMLTVMVHAPRFSLAYGTLAAPVAAFVSPVAIGLPIAAAGWALTHRTRTSGTWRRAGLAMVPLLAAIVILRLNADNARWLGGSALRWRGGLDRVFQAAGVIVGDQLAPGSVNAALRFLVIADCAVILIAIVVMAWRRVGRSAPESSVMRWLHPAAGVLTLAYAAGLAVRTMLVRGSAEPDLAAVFPLVVVSVLVIVASVAALWPRWPRWGKVLTLILLVGWMQAAVR